MSQKCKGHTYTDTSRWFPRRRGTIKQWQREPCQAWAKRGDTHCAAHQDQKRRDE